MQEEVQKMSNAKKNFQKNMAVNYRFGQSHQKSLKKSSSKSLKILMDGNKIQPAGSKKPINTETCEGIISRRKIELSEEKKTECLFNEKKSQAEPLSAGKNPGNSQR